LGRHDIALLNGIPNDVPVVSAIITTEFQTPLSHINILSKNRKTPNMALRSGWDNELFNSLVNKLVRLEVTSDYFSMREATLTEAQAYWDSHEPQQPQKLNLDTLTTGLIELSNAGYNSTKTIGGKASNFAEMQKIGSIPLPEAGFAIPFYYYRDHLKQNRIIPFMEQMFKDEDFQQNASIRHAWLERLRDTIKQTPINPELLALVSQKMQQSGFPSFRLRSSTNAEDIEGFNGAGLYDSYTAIPGDADKTIEKAIKKVWASLWNFRAFEEREYFKIDHNSTAMGILVNRSFPAEDANGVVITTNLYNSNLPAYVINAQFFEYSVVRPEDNVLPEQIIFYQMEQPYTNRIEYINRSTLPGKENEYVLSAEEVTKLAGLCRQISVHYCNLLGKCIPLDIEFKVDSTVTGTRKLYVKQVRPFTR
jgi:phosphoenolpyruvate synthase/pyruvate phosphate dikinase